MNVISTEEEPECDFIQGGPQQNLHRGPGYPTYRPAHTHTHSYIFKIFVRSPWFPPQSERGHRWKACYVNYAVCLHACVCSKGKCKHIFVRPTVMTVYIGHNFCWESLSSSEKNYAGVIRLEFAHNTWGLQNSQWAQQENELRLMLHSDCNNFCHTKPS